MEEKKKLAANDYQIGGSHYRNNGTDIQHWDYCWAKKFDQFQYQITKYVERWRSKNGIADLKKARHFLDKYIELVEKNLPEAKPTITFATSPTTKEVYGTLNKVQFTKTNTGQENPFGFNAGEEI